MKITLLKSIVLPVAASCALLGVYSAKAAYPDLILGDKPVGYFRLEELQGAPSAVDSSTNNLPSTIMYDPNGASDPVLGSPGIDTNSYSFQNYTDTNSVVHTSSVDVPFNQLLAPVAVDGTHGTAFSAECWVEPTSYNTAGGYPVPLAAFGAYGGGIYGNASGWNFYQTPGTSPNWVLNMRNVTFASDPAAVQLLQWYHLAVTFDGTNAYFYVNGHQNGPFASGGAYLADNGSDITIGNGPTTGQPAFNGGVDEVAFYNYALTSTQITAHYTLGTNSFRQTTTGAGILNNPTPQTNYSGTSVTFTGTGSGTTPLSYQWYRGSTAIAGATNTVYSFVTQYTNDNNAMFSFVVTNAYGKATSSVVTLAVLTNLNILGNPNSITRNIGSWSAFRVAANGALPITYQWYNTTTPGTSNLIARATNATLWIKAATNATYHVVVSNPFTTTDCPDVSLSVQARSEFPGQTNDLYYKIVMADDPVAYWRLDETNADGGTAVDAAGTFDGTYFNLNGTFTFGATTGIPHTTDPGVNLTNKVYIDVPYAPELNPDTVWSVEEWLQPSSLDRDGNDYRVVLSSEYNLYPNPYNGWYIYQKPSNDFAFVPNPGGAFVNAAPDDPANNNQLVVGKWYHLVVTDDGTSFNVYINGELRGTDLLTDPLANFIPNGTFGYPTIAGGDTVIGERTDGAFNEFQGTVDDTAFYRYALTPAQVLAHYTASVKVGLTTTSVAGKLVLTWPTGTLQSATNAAGPYADVAGATSPYTNTVSGTQKFFRAHVAP